LSAAAVRTRTRAKGQIAGTFAQQKTRLLVAAPLRRKHGRRTARARTVGSSSAGALGAAVMEARACTTGGRRSVALAVVVLLALAAKQTSAQGVGDLAGTDFDPPGAWRAETQRARRGRHFPVVRRTLRTTAARKRDRRAPGRRLRARRGCARALRAVQGDPVRWRGSTRAARAQRAGVVEPAVSSDM
jgi:hypothetical protein